MAARSSLLPRAVGVVVGAGLLAAYLGGTLLLGLMDAAFDYGGKAPMLLVVVGAALAMAGYWGGESAVRRLR